MIGIALDDAFGNPSGLSTGIPLHMSGPSHQQQQQQQVVSLSSSLAGLQQQQQLLDSSGSTGMQGVRLASTGFAFGGAPATSASAPLFSQGAAGAAMAQSQVPASGSTPPSISKHHIASASSTTGKVLSGGAYVEVYDPDFQHVITVSSDRVTHTPHPSLGVSRLVLCRNYSPENPAGCTKGETCKFVHADVLGAKKHPIHVNYAWRSEDLVTYPRLPAGEKLMVLAPNERPPAEEVPSERVLVTRGSLMRKEHSGPLSHCAHYYFNRMCNRGERCNFIHAVLVDPNATELQRAPAPTSVAPLPRQVPRRGQTQMLNGSVLSASSSSNNALLPASLLPGISSSQQLGGQTMDLQQQMAALLQQAGASHQFAVAGAAGTAPNGQPLLFAGGQPNGSPQMFFVPTSHPTMAMGGGANTFAAPAQAGQIFYMPQPQPNTTPPNTMSNNFMPQLWNPNMGHPGVTTNTSNENPSMTSIFLVPVSNDPSQQQPQGAAPQMAPQQPPPQQQQQPMNPLDWSFVGSVYNNGSVSSHSQSFSHSLSGRAFPHTQLQ